MNVFNRARAFIYRNARPLDFARFQYHFEKGGKAAVLNALAAYQNSDGGFGNALEPDALNPASSPIQTWAATEILREIHFTDGNHPIIKGILRYLESGKDNICLAGFIIRFADKNSGLYQLGKHIAVEAVEALKLGDRENDLCYIRLMEYAKIREIEPLLRERVQKAITKNPAEWETGYVCKPSRFFNRTDSVFYADNKEIADFECDFILRTQQSDGAWAIPCGANYPDERSENWRRASDALLNLLFLKGMGKLSDMIAVKPLTPDLADDYFNFFDGRAFSDNAEWSACFCTYFHMNDESEREVGAEVKSGNTLRGALRGRAERFVANGIIRGYLAYADGVPVGFCNANDKSAYARDLNGFGSDGNTKAAVCFTVAPGYRGRGVASALLEQVILDAKAEGYAAVEGYPKLSENDNAKNFTGPIRLYQKFGFAEAERLGDRAVMRKEL